MTDMGRPNSHALVGEAPTVGILPVSFDLCPNARRLHRAPSASRDRPWEISSTPNLQDDQIYRGFLAPSESTRPTLLLARSPPRDPPPPSSRLAVFPTHGFASGTPRFFDLTHQSQHRDHCLRLDAGRLSICVDRLENGGWKSKAANVWASSHAAERGYDANMLTYLPFAIHAYLTN